MAQPTGPNPPPEPPRRQFNTARHNSNVFANNGGEQNVNITQTGAHPRRTWAWISLAIFFVADLVFFQYGQSAYTNGADQSGDLDRALIFIVLLIGTGIVFTVCVRDIKRRLF
ncbi:hypothetical protein GFY24_30235 [Nocardia sp. SYP-A9097]|uniref:hypothetical protein n=1 Tax=Nocardia sp. SYP-A9097 TaxID=2663237 RepID=UPI00129A1EAC|nr:hypothetical protein [Nocardia sp. SYP-A9097]MRH91669.1 hypothetical protein [Nocardia sp. SYP-A9097]